MNTMRDMSQFVVIVIVHDDPSATLAESFFQHTFIKFDWYHIFVLDDGSIHKNVFVAISKALDLNYDILTKLNRKGLTVDHFRWFLNKTTIIVMKDR